MSKDQELESLHSNAHIKDEATGEVVEITPELRDEAMQVHGQIEGAFWQIANALSRIVNERLYLAIGYESFEKYCADTLPWKARQAYDYALAGTEFGTKLIGDNGEEHPKAEKYQKFGISKIKLLASQASDQVDRLIKEGKITIGDFDITDDEIADMRVKEMREMLKSANKKAEKAEVETEKRKNAELERDQYKKEADELRERDKKYRERSDTQEQIEQDLKEFDRCWETMQKILTRVEVEDQQEHLQIEFVERLNRLQKGSERFNALHTELLLIHNDPIIQ